VHDTEIILVAALVGGALAAAVRLPPLVGFLVAGFVLAVGGVESTTAVETVAGLGVTVLLFAVGLKIRLGLLGRREVLATSVVHLAGSTALGFLVIGVLALLGVGAAAALDARGLLLVAFALSFSSTVLVVKLLEERNASRSLGGRTAVGVLVIQDLAAVAFLAVAEGTAPSPWAVLVLLLLPCGPLLRAALGRLGHDELLPLFGIVLALVPGYWLFESVGLKGDLGALAVGMLLATAPRADELAKSIFTVKELLLVGFFVSVGLTDAPDAGEFLLACALLALLPLKAVGFAVLFWGARFRRRTSVLTALTLTNFSEFGLIVVVAAPAGLLGPEWTSILGTAVALSFVLTSLMAGREERLVATTRQRLPQRPVDELHEEDRPLDVTGVEAVVLGMGRVGRAAYERLHGHYGLRTLGIEADQERCERLRAAGFAVAEADATDPETWSATTLHDATLIVLAMPFHGSNLAALAHVRTSGFDGAVAVVVQYDEQLVQAAQAGADTGLQIYDGAGAELADRAIAVHRLSQEGP